MFSHYKESDLKIVLFTLLSLICVEGLTERSYTEAEKESFMNIWNTAKSIALIGVDDDLEPAVAALLATPPTNQTEDNAYVYLLGLNEKFAGASDDPYAAGLAFYQQLKADYADGRDLLGESIRPTELHTPNEPSVCDQDWVVCHERALHDSSALIDMEQSIKLHQIYVDLMQCGHFQQIPRSVFENTSMHLQYVRYVQDINHQYLLSQTSSRDLKWIASQVLTEHQTLRSWQTHANDWFTQMMLSGMIRQNVELINYLVQQQLIPPAAVLQAVLPVTQGDRSIRQVLLSEAAVEYRYILDFNEHVMQLQGGEMVEGVLFRQALTQLMSKPNMSINQDFNHRIKPLLAFDQLSAQEMKDHAGIQSRYAPVDRIRNFAGSMHQLMMGAGAQSYVKMKMNLYDLQMQINLLRGLLAEGTPAGLIHKAEQGESAYLNVYDLSVPFMAENQICQQGIQGLGQPRICLVWY